MDTWHPLGDRNELLARVPFAVKLDRHRIAVFHYEGAFHAIADGCNHRGGPLSEGRLRGERTGRGSEGFDEEQVPVFAYEGFLARHRDALPKFAGEPSPARVESHPEGAS